MRRSQWAALLGAVLLLAAAFAVRALDDAQADTPDLAPLRAAAALGPCPAGLGPDLPDLVLPCLGGGPDVDLRGAAPGRPTLINMWGTWCVPCVEEVPELVAFADRAEGRVGVVGVLTQDTPANGLEFARQFGVHYPSLVDDQGTLFRRYRAGLPVTLFLDAQGRLVHAEGGQIDTAAELEALVAQHLGVRL